MTDEFNVSISNTKIVSKINFWYLKFKISNVISLQEAQLSSGSKLLLIIIVNCYYVK